MNKSMSEVIYPETAILGAPDVSPEIKERFRATSYRLTERIEEATLNPETFRSRGIVQNADVVAASGGEILLHLDRKSRTDRKLDKAMRKFLSAEDTSGTDGYLVYPYDSNLEPQCLYQRLIDIFPRDGDYTISVARQIQNYEVCNERGRILGAVDYILSVDPLQPRKLVDIEQTSPTVLWIMAGIAQGDFDEVRGVLSEPQPTIAHIETLGKLWTALRIAEKQAALTEQGSEVSSESDITREHHASHLGGIVLAGF